MKLKQTVNNWVRKSIYLTINLDELDNGENYIFIPTTRCQLPHDKTLEFNHYKCDNHLLAPTKLSNVLDFTMTLS